MARKNVWQSRLGAAAILAAMTAASGCGDSIATLNGLAASGSIHEGAPVKAHLQMRIAAPPAKVWALLVDAPSWPKWNKQIESVSATEPMRRGARFSWKTGGETIHCQVQLFDPEHRLAWTGTALTAKAVHVWELAPEAGNQTLVSVRESMDGPWMAELFPSQKLAKSDLEWLTSLEHAAEGSQLTSKVAVSIGQLSVPMRRRRWVQ